MTPPDAPVEDLHEPHYPCDVCGTREIEIVKERGGKFSALCLGCTRRVRLYASRESAIEAWEDTMMEAQREAKEDRRNDRE